jgi:hypothetical protein
MSLGKVKVGEEELSIARFRGHKAILAGAMIKRVMERTPQINDKISDFRKKYREDNYFEITPRMAHLPQFQELYGVSPDMFKDDAAPIRFPANPDGQAIFMYIFPELFTLARDELMVLLALIVVSDRELSEADDADQVEDLLKKRGKQLLRDGYLEELMELTIVAWEVLKDQIMSNRERLGKLRNVPFLGTLLSTQEEETPEPDEDQTPPTSMDASPTLSTDLPDSTDGLDERPSTESPGPSFSSSSPSMKE